MPMGETMPWKVHFSSRPAFRCGAVLVAAALLAGCSTFWTSTVSRTKPIRDGEVLVTTADLRAVTRTTREGRTITCAEPSPDVAKIASASLDSSVAASASSVGNVANPEIAAALAMSRAEGLAQLGQRLATIQLLRDGLYRACEGYANGAINERIYATILSRYDDVMVTMLLGEFAAAKPSALPALLTGSAGGSAAAFAGPSEELKTQLEAIEAEQAKQRQTETEIATKEGEVAQATTPEDRAAREAELGELKTQSAEQQKTIGEMEKAAAAMSLVYARAQNQVATSAPTQGTIAGGTDTGAAAAALYGMQKNYLDDFSFDGLAVGCLASVTTDEHMKNFCTALGNNPEIVRRLLELRSLDLLIRAAGSDADALAKLAAMVAEINKIKAALVPPVPPVLPVPQQPVPLPQPSS
jgi:hypothetical protein